MAVLDSSVHNRRSLLPLAWCAAASLGVLFVKSSAVFGFPGRVPEGPSVADYLPYAVPGLALILWRMRPDKAGPWLLVAGAVFALPMALTRITPDVYQPWMYDPILATARIAPACTLIGLLAVATVLWRGGQRTAGVVLTGVGLIVQPLGPIVTGSTFHFRADDVLIVIGLVLVVIALAGALGALLIAPAAPAVQVGWRITIVGGVVAAAQFAYMLYQPTFIGTSPTDQIADYHLGLALIFLAVGVVGGVVAGPRALVAAAAAGLLMGAFGALISPSVEVLGEMAVIAVIAALASLALGCALAATRWRAQLGIGGIGVVVAGLMVIFTLFNGDDPLSSYDVFTRALTPVLLVIGVAAAVAAVAEIGDRLAPHGEAPPVLVGLATAFSLAAVHFTAYFAMTTPDGKAQLVGILPPVMVALVIAAGLIAYLARSRPSDRDQTVQDAL